ncbi:fasciclin domain-containing protein [Brevundimonas sp.]|uniref:fasciclin domain-containing protein n=1 Tax=Brevundimonas sp. TaxID=1871086 RepID=UPI00286D6739|nr:fasciclin domain-containing protein [Brevundimonas sp.]
MLRTRLLTATAAVALFAAGSAFAQTAPTAPVGPATTPPVAAEDPVEAPAAAAAQAATNAAPPTQSAPVVENNVVDVLRANGQFTTLLTALDAAQLTETLSTQPAISIFAPTDAAFAALPEADRTRLMDPANVNELRQVLLYHVIVADVDSSQLEGAKGGVQTAATTEVQLDGTGDAIKVDNATVTTADVDAGNGAIFIIDRVLNPAESLVATGDAEAATAPAADDTATETPPVDEAVEGPPPADDAVTTDDSATAESMDADSAADEGAVAPPPTTPAASTTAEPTTPAVTSPTSTTGTTGTTRPATGVNAPNGQPAATTTTVASPTVPNPTDGQVDEEDADETPTPTPQS